MQQCPTYFFFMLFPGWLAEAKAQKILDLFSDLDVKTIVLDLLRRVEENPKVDVPLILEKIESSSLKKMLNRGLIQKESRDWDQEKWRPVYEGAVRKIKQKSLESVEKDLLRQIRDFFSAE